MSGETRQFRVSARIIAIVPPYPEMRVLQPIRQGARKDFHARTANPAHIRKWNAKKANASTKWAIWQADREIPKIRPESSIFRALAVSTRVALWGRDVARSKHQLRSVVFEWVLRGKRIF